MQEETTILCPFCEEGELQKVRCASCGKNFLRCDECDAIYKDKNSLDEDYGAECPHCGAGIE